MTDEREVWIKLAGHTAEGEQISHGSRAQNGSGVGAPDQLGNSPHRTTPTVSFRPLAVILGLLLGWVGLVLVLGVFLPASTEQMKALRGALYLGYMVVATIVVARSLRRAASKL